MEVADRAAEDLVVAYEMDKRIELTAVQTKGMMNYFREIVRADLDKQMNKDPDFMKESKFDIAEMEIAEDILDGFKEDEQEKGAQDTLEKFGQDDD